MDSGTQLTTEQGINNDLTPSFESIVSELPVTKKVALHYLISALTKVKHFTESVNARSLCVYLIICAVSQYTDEWSDKARTKRCILSWILDPLTFPTPEEQPEGWEFITTEVLDQFYDNEVE